MTLTRQDSCHGLTFCHLVFKLHVCQLPAEVGKPHVRACALKWNVYSCRKQMNLERTLQKQNRYSPKLEDIQTQPHMRVGPLEEGA